MANLDMKMDMKLDVIDLEEKTYMARIEMIKEQCMLAKMIVGDRERPKLIQNGNRDIKHERYKTSLRFENISERSRDRIIEYIFEMMRENTMK